MDPTADLMDQLASLAGKLKDEDLKDPVIAGLLGQLSTVLSPSVEPLSLDLVEQLQNIPDKIQRFKTAAQLTGMQDPDNLTRLAHQLRASGLMKAEDLDL